MKIGFFNILTIIFVIAKLAGAITWSWWLVFAPTILSVGLVFIFGALYVLSEVWGDT